MSMEDLDVMILTRNKKIFYVFIISMFLNSCESFKRISGLEKPVIDDAIIQETPDLILPPEFDSKPLNENINSYSEKRFLQDDEVYIEDNLGSQNYAIPMTKKYIAPKIIMPSSRSPSDSIEKFRNKRTNSIGEWVFSQSVNDFKNGNIYFRPIYDKGYNFNRRYTPTPSKHPPLNSFIPGINKDSKYSQRLEINKNIEMSGKLPISE